eukprot:scaffold101009_cov63-Phaeocystis_antarctica.AAC.4
MRKLLSPLGGGATYVTGTSTATTAAVGDTTLRSAAPRESSSGSLKSTSTSSATPAALASGARQRISPEWTRVAPTSTMPKRHACVTPRWKLLPRMVTSRPATAGPDAGTSAATRVCGTGTSARGASLGMGAQRVTCVALKSETEVAVLAALLTHEDAICGGDGRREQCGLRGARAPQRAAARLECRRDGRRVPVTEAAAVLRARAVRELCAADAHPRAARLGPSGGRDGGEHDGQVQREEHCPLAEEPRVRELLTVERDVHGGEHRLGEAKQARRVAQEVCAAGRADPVGRVRVGGWHDMLAEAAARILSRAVSKERPVRPEAVRVDQHERRARCGAARWYEPVHGGRGVDLPCHRRAHEDTVGVAGRVRVGDDGERCGGARQQRRVTQHKVIDPTQRRVLAWHIRAAPRTEPHAPPSLRRPGRVVPQRDAPRLARVAQLELRAARRLGSQPSPTPRLGTARARLEREQQRPVEPHTHAAPRALAGTCRHCGGVRRGLAPCGARVQQHVQPSARAAGGGGGRRTWRGRGGEWWRVGEAEAVLRAAIEQQHEGEAWRNQHGAAGRRLDAPRRQGLLRPSPARLRITRRLGSWAGVALLLKPQVPPLEPRATVQPTTVGQRAEVGRVGCSGVGRSDASAGGAWHRTELPPTASRVASTSCLAPNRSKRHSSAPATPLRPAALTSTRVAPSAGPSIGEIEEITGRGAYAYCTPSVVNSRPLSESSRDTPPPPPPPAPPPPPRSAYGGAWHHTVVVELRVALTTCPPKAQRTTSARAEKRRPCSTTAVPPAVGPWAGSRWETRCAK